MSKFDCDQGVKWQVLERMSSVGRHALQHLRRRSLLAGVVDGAVAQLPDGRNLPRISDDHVDFGKANSHALATLEEAIVRVTALRDRLRVAAIDRREPRRHRATTPPADADLGPI